MTWNFFYEIQLKEFQSRKQDLTTAPEVAENHVQQQQHSDVQQQQPLVFAAFDPPRISNYFDSLNGQSFDIPQQHALISNPNAEQQEIQEKTATPEHFATNSEQFRNDKIDEQNHQITQLKSELEFHRSTATNLQRNIDELNKLKQESHSHADVVKVLVSEKSSLIDQLEKSAQENEELHNRLNASRHRVKKLESDVLSGRPILEAEVDTKKIEEIVAASIKELKDSNDQIESEKRELKVLLSQKRIELENLQKNFDHLNTELHLANVKISQLCDGAPSADHSNESQMELAIKQEQITELSNQLDQTNRDKEVSDNQYQNYISHLLVEMETLKENSFELSNENDLLVKREQDLLKHVSEIERHMQQQIQKQKTYAEIQKETSTGPSEEFQELKSQISALTESNDTLKSQLAKIEAERDEIIQSKLEEIKDMEMKIEHLSTTSPNLSQLMTDFEDKSVAASRALSQNQALKDQLNEMQNAFMTLTNDKMQSELRLQSQMHLAKEMKIQFDSMTSELQEMKDKWHFKEDEMIRLSHENTELEKKIEQLRHGSNEADEGILENELDNCKRLIQTLSNKIHILESDRKPPGHIEIHNHEGHQHDDHGHSHTHKQHIETQDHSCVSNDSKILLEEIEMLKMEKNELLKAITDFQMSKKSAEKSSDELTVLSNGAILSPELSIEGIRQVSVPKSVTPSMATEEALEKLQSRFRRTMLEVAELTEEKQRLEHVVTQLQFETETIGKFNFGYLKYNFSCLHFIHRRVHHAISISTKAPQAERA